MLQIVENAVAPVLFDIERQRLVAQLLQGVEGLQQALLVFEVVAQAQLVDQQVDLEFVARLFWRRLDQRLAVVGQHRPGGFGVTGVDPQHVQTVDRFQRGSLERLDAQLAQQVIGTVFLMLDLKTVHELIQLNAGQHGAVLRHRELHLRMTCASPGAPYWLFKETTGTRIRLHSTGNDSERDRAIQRGCCTLPVGV
ncbi:hypothetical protein D3C76_1340040 [compost metagenome]